MLTLYLQYIFKFLCTNIPFINEKKLVGHRLGTVSIFLRGVGAWWERRSKPMQWLQFSKFSF